MSDLAIVIVLGVWLIGAIGFAVSGLDHEHDWEFAFIVVLWPLCTLLAIIGYAFDAARRRWRW